MAQYYIYCHINKINGKRYIGLTNEEPPSKRWGSNGINYKSCTCFYNAIQKYGWNNFEHIILEKNLTAKQAEQMEKKYIKLYNTMVPNGYNLTGGGELKKEISDITRERLRQSHLGYKVSKETKKKMSKSRKGHPGYNCKAVWMCDKNTHQRLKLFSSLTEAGNFLHKNHAHIGHVCKGERSSAYGYFWEFDQNGEG